MKFDVNKPEVLSSGSLDSVEIHLGDPNVIFDLLRKQYTYPIQTPVQEAVCNARDSHRQAKQTRKIEIKLPSATYPFFSVRDFGTSMSDHDFSKVWAGMGNSTKRDSNEFTGGFGIGSKAWFAYRDNWFYKIHYGGKVKTYEITTAKVYSGSAELRDVADSNEPQGIEVIVPIKPDDIHKFEKAFYRATYFWSEEERPIIMNREPEEISDKWMNKADKFKLNNEIEFHPKDVISAFSNNYDSSRNFILVIDGIPYIVQAPLLNNAITYDAYNSSSYGRTDSAQESVKEKCKDYQPLCDILRTAHYNSDKKEMKVPIFIINVGEIKLVNHRESIDFSEENINKVINLIYTRKLELDHLILNTCKKLLQDNLYNKAFDFCNKWQRIWLITHLSSTHYVNLLPYPFQYNPISFNHYGHTSNWSWIKTDPNLHNNNAIFSYHKILDKVYLFHNNRALNFNRKSVFVIKDDTEKKEILIKKKLNMLKIQDFYIIDLTLLPEDIRDGFRDVCYNLTFGEWWLKTGLLDEEIKKTTKKDSSVISIHYLSEGKRYSVSKNFEGLQVDPRFKNIIFMKMKNNRPDTAITVIDPLIDFLKYFFNKNVAMVTEDNYNILLEKMGDNFIDFHVFLDELKTPSQDTMEKLEDMILKFFVWKQTVQYRYDFLTIPYIYQARSYYITELTLYLMFNDKNLKINKSNLNSLVDFGINLERMNEILLSLTNPDQASRKTYDRERSIMEKLFFKELISLFPPVLKLINTLEKNYAELEVALCNTLPFLQYILSNQRDKYQRQEEIGKEYQIHPIIIENLKKVEME